MSNYENVNLEKKVEFRKAYAFEILWTCFILHFVACCYAATTNLANNLLNIHQNSIVLKFMLYYVVSMFGLSVLVIMLFAIKRIFNFVLVVLKHLYHIRAIYHTREKNRALPITLEEMHSLNIFSLEEYFSFLTSYVKSTLISKSNARCINNKVFLTLEQFFDFERSMFDLFTLARNNEDFIVNDKSKLSTSKKKEYEKFIYMLKNFNEEDSELETHFVDNDLNEYVDDKSKINISLFDNVLVQYYYKQEDQFVDVFINIKNCLE